MKIPLFGSFAYLCGFIGTLHDCVNILAAGKQDVNAAVPFTIPISGWGTDDSVPSHPYYLDVTVTGLSDTDIVDVTVAPVSASVARMAGFTNTQSYTGRFRLRCQRVPETAIQAEYHITNTAEYSAG